VFACTLSTEAGFWAVAFILFWIKERTKKITAGRKWLNPLLPALKFIKLVRGAHSDTINFGRFGRSRFRDAIFFKAGGGRTGSTRKALQPKCV